MVHFDKLVEIMDRLRSPEGCSWDLKQTHQSSQRFGCLTLGWASGCVWSSWP